jgi:signal transduction histidine kinase
LREFVEVTLQWDDAGMRESVSVYDEAEIRELERLAAEQAALRQVATMVAGGSSPNDVFATVAESVGALLAADVAAIWRYEPDGQATLVATWGDLGGALTAGSRWKVDGHNVTALVYRTGRSARIDDYDQATGLIAAELRKRRVRSTVGSPVVVGGRVWGVVGASSKTDPMPEDAELRLVEFTELVATAISNLQARSEVQRLAEQQTALRRVATLVARGVPPEELFASVAEELARLLLAEIANLIRYEPDGTFTMLASTAGFPVGRRWPIGGKNPTTRIFETGRPARSDDYADNATGPQVGTAREVGLRSTVGAPIIVEGRVWGAIGVGTNSEAPLPPDTETRLVGFTELVATAIANADSRAALEASRARMVAAADESRRRIERDLHDGAQKRLVHTVIVQKLAIRALQDGDSNLGDLMAEALKHAEQANHELTELAHGILPSVLTREGLLHGIRALVSRMSLPVSLDVTVERLPASIEATAYFIVSEALTNVVKHAHADRAAVTARVERGVLRVEICDEGAGGAHLSNSTGLRGLEDRVSALEGHLMVESPPGQGTRVCALLPVPASA